MRLKGVWSTILPAKNIEKKKTVEKEETVCSIRITCTEPKDDGTMQVEMTYEGDKTLASYLLQSAQQMFDE